MYDEAIHRFTRPSDSQIINQHLLSAIRPGDNHRLTEALINQQSPTTAAILTVVLRSHFSLTTSLLLRHTHTHLFNAALSCSCFVQTHCGQVIVSLRHQSILNLLCFRVFFLLRCSLFSGFNETDYYLHMVKIVIKNNNI